MTRLVQKGSILSRLLVIFCLLAATNIVPADAKRKCKTVKDVSIIDSDDGPYYQYSASHDMPPVGLKYDPMERITGKINTECKKACLKDKGRCGAWRTVLSGNSGGASAHCGLYEKGTYKLVKDKTGLPSCGRAVCKCSTGAKKIIYFSEEKGVDKNKFNSIAKALLSKVFFPSLKGDDKDVYGCGKAGIKKANQLWLTTV
eukprot:jgi/Picsp_1/6296/NSC_03646-R1_---NA---